MRKSFSLKELKSVNGSVIRKLFSSFKYIAKEYPEQIDELTKLANSIARQTSVYNDVFTASEFEERLDSLEKSNENKN